MSPLFYKLLGVPGDDIAKMADASLELRGFSGEWIFLLGLAVIGIAVWSYHRWAEHLSFKRRWMMIALRAGFLALLCFLLLRPVLHFTVEGSIRRAMVILFDDSQSMQIKDERTGDDLKRAGIALGQLDATKGLEQSVEAPSVAVARPGRVELAQSLLRNPKASVLPRLAEDYDLRPYAFGSTLNELTGPGESDKGKSSPDAWLDQIKATESTTRLGDALREAIGRSRGQPLAGIVLVTDGASNSGGAPLAAAELAKQQGVPLYVYGVGITSPRDLAVTNLFAQPVAFFDDEVPVTVRVRSRGMEGKKTKLRLQLIPKDPPGAPADESIEREITLEEGEKVISVSITPKKKAESDKSREYTLVASVDPTGAEASAEALSRSQSLRVVDGKIKVLYIEQAPRWEYRYLHSMLLRDRRVRLKVVLLDAGEELSRDPGSPYLAGVPTNREELFDNDLIIFGDVNPKSLTAEQMEMMGEFVSKFGGGMLFVAGRRNGIALLRGTPLEKMLPVELEESIGRERTSTNTDRPIRLELTAAGQRSTLMQLTDPPAENTALWAKLPPIYWAAKVSRAKPAAEVLLVDGDPGKAWRNDKMPIFALQQYGSGQVFYSGTDNTWRWRPGKGAEHYTTLWGQIVQRLALPHVLGETNRTRLSSDRQEYATGDRITLYARLYNADYSPLQQGQIEGTWTNSSGRTGRVVLRPEQPGVYRGEMVAGEPGGYQFSVESDKNTKLGFDVTEPKLEMAEPAMNEALLRQMADVTGGQFYREETLHELPDQVKLKTERVRSSLDVEIWSSPLFFILLMLLPTIEWVMRKMSQLK